jgi:hypothetical protein
MLSNVKLHSLKEELLKMRANRKSRILVLVKKSDRDKSKAAVKCAGSSVEDRSDRCVRVTKCVKT